MTDNNNPIKIDKEEFIKEFSFPTDVGEKIYKQKNISLSQSDDYDYDSTFFDACFFIKPNCVNINHIRQDFFNRC